MQDDGTSLRDNLIVCGLLCFIIFFVCLSTCSCSSQTVKPKTSVDSNVKTSLDNQQKMSEKIDTLNGNMTKVQETLNVVETNISTKIDQKFETLQGSTKTGDVGGNVKSSQDSNSAMYGIGLVVVVLIFALVLIWMLAKISIKMATKVLK